MNTTITCKYPNRLKEHRMQLGLKQEDIALKLNLKNSKDRISHWERGQMMPSGLNLLKLAKVFNVSVEELYTPLQ